MVRGIWKEFVRGVIWLIKVDLFDYWLLMNVACACSVILIVGLWTVLLYAVVWEFSCCSTHCPFYGGIPSEST
jgi:hypothetical protein